MRLTLLIFAGTTLALVSSLRAGSMELAPKEITPPSITQSEPWQFTIAVPGLMPSIDGTIGVRGVNANIDIGLGQILEHLDMIFAMRAEARKGPFGISAETSGEAGYGATHTNPYGGVFVAIRAARVVSLCLQAAVGY